MEWPDDDLDPETYFASIREREELDVEKFVDAAERAAAVVEQELAAVREGLVSSPDESAVAIVRDGKVLIGLLASSRTFLLQARDTEMYAERYQTDTGQFGAAVTLAADYARAGEAGLRAGSRIAAAEREMRAAGWL